MISNVPAAVRLAPFTDDYPAIILGTNIGGLGTLIASLASLISYKLYCKTEHANPPKYLAQFTGYNMAYILLILLFTQFY